MRIPSFEYYKFILQYYNTKPQHLRLGQAFWNQFLTHDSQVEDRLFYTESTEKALDIITQHYVDFEEFERRF